jgi:hypothetical protein
MYIITRVDTMQAVKRTRAAAWIAFFALAIGLHSLAPDVSSAPCAQAERPGVPAGDVLKEIYVEVKELGPYPGESFIKHEFFLGPADDDSYKKEHIVVLIQVVDGVDRMRIQVTEMKNRPDNPRIQLAGKARTIICSVSAGGALTLLRSDYGDKEIVCLAPDILRAVREKKKLLEELRAKSAGSL